VSEEPTTPSPDGGWSGWPAPAREPEAVVPLRDAHLRRVVRLETLVDTRETGERRSMSVSARHEAVLDDASRVLLLDDRGWTGSLRGAGAETMDAWALQTEDEIAKTARDVVGPDEPYGDRSSEDMAAGHWDTLAGTLRAQGVIVEAADLRRLPHDVVLSDRLRARLT
jgi:hypothetical protein